MPRSADAAKPRIRNTVRCYGLALCVGIVAVAITFPLWALLGRLPPAAPYSADLAQQVVAQRYFLGEPWHWPLLHIDGLMQPMGINLAFADGIPMAALIAKLLRPVLPPFDQAVTTWLALCWLAQPVAAVFALRSAGEQRASVAMCVAMLAACQPCFIGRLRHATLSAHFPLLVLLGCYLRAAGGSRVALWAGCAVAASLMLVHPYLLVMGLAFPAAACLSLLLRKDHRWREAALALCATVVVVVATAVALGLAKGGAAGVYGVHTTNLIGLFYPARSGLFSGFPFAMVDATGGQEEGYAYLGAGLLLVLACVASRPWAVWLAIRRHAGLAAASVVMTLLALSHRVFLFHTLVFHLHTATGVLDNFRASGRFIWVATYTLLIGGVVLLIRASPRLATAILPAAALLAVLDARVIWAHDRHLMADPASWFFDPDRMRSLLRAHARLTVLPEAGCVKGFDMGLMQPLWLAAETRMPTSTMYIARKMHVQSCDVASGLQVPPGEGELILVQPGFLRVADRSPAASFCRQIGAYAACTRDVASLAGLPGIGAEVTIPAQPPW